MTLRVRAAQSRTPKGLHGPTQRCRLALPSMCAGQPTRQDAPSACVASVQPSRSSTLGSERCSGLHTRVQLGIGPPHALPVSHVRVVLRGRQTVSTRILGKSMRDALGIRKGGKGAYAYPRS